jgi:hypothetical protein
MRAWSPTAAKPGACYDAASRKLSQESPPMPPSRRPFPHSTAGALLVVALLSGCRAGLKAPEEVRAIQCNGAGTGSDDTDIFRVGETRLALACQRSGGGKEMAARWALHNAKGWNDSGMTYRFRKRADGGLDRKQPEVSALRPVRSVSRYLVTMQFDTATNAQNNIMPARFRELKVPTPAAFALTGPETVFICQHPKLHDQMKHECGASLRSPGLYWRIDVVFGYSSQEPSIEDALPELVEAYQFAAAHIMQ